MVGNVSGYLAYFLGIMYDAHTSINFLHFMQIFTRISITNQYYDDIKIFVFVFYDTGTCRNDI